MFTSGLFLQAYQWQLIALFSLVKFLYLYNTDSFQSIPVGTKVLTVMKDQSVSDDCIKHLVKSQKCNECRDSTHVSTHWSLTHNVQVSISLSFWAGCWRPVCNVHHMAGSAGHHTSLISYQLSLVVINVSLHLKLLAIFIILGMESSQWTYLMIFSLIDLVLAIEWTGHWLFHRCNG